MIIVIIMLKSLKISEAGQVEEFLEQVGHEVHLADGQIEIKLSLALHPKYYHQGHHRHHHHHQCQDSRRLPQHHYGPTEILGRERGRVRDLTARFQGKYLENL